MRLTTALSIGLVAATLAVAPAARGAPPRDPELSQGMATIIRGFYANWHCDIAGPRTGRELIYLYAQLYPAAMKRTLDREALIRERKAAQAEALRMKAAGDCARLGPPLIAEGLKQARAFVFAGLGKPYLSQRSDLDYLATRYALVFIGLYIDRNCQVQSAEARRRTTERFARIDATMRAEFRPEQIDALLGALKQSRAYLERFNCSPRNRDQIALLPAWLGAMERYVGIKAFDDLEPPPPSDKTGITRF
jgi:hypothetical protein